MQNHRHAQDGGRPAIVAGRNAMKRWRSEREAAPFRHATINDGNTSADRTTINDGNTSADRTTIAAALLKRERKARRA